MHRFNLKVLQLLQLVDALGEVAGLSFAEIESDHAGTEFSNPFWDGCQLVFRKIKLLQLCESPDGVGE